MVWDETVLEQFDIIDPLTTDESDFYGPYNSLLVTLFPLEEHFQVAPRYERIPGSFGYTVFYIVMESKVPVFFLNIKTLLSLGNGLSRAAADTEMRNGFLEFSSSSSDMPKLFGISMMGTHFAVYEYTTHDCKLVPSTIAPHPDIVVDTAPAERWSYNIMEANGEAKIKAIVAEIKQMLLPD